MASHSVRSAALAALAVLVIAGCAESADSPGPAAPATEAVGGGTAASEEPSDQTAPEPEEADTLPATIEPDPSTPAAPPEPAGESPAEASVAWCSPEALAASVRGLQPAAGNRYAALVLTNTSGAPCRTRGWPGLQLTTGSGDDIRTTTVRSRATEARQVTVAPGESVWTRLRWSPVPGSQDPAEGRCAPEPAGLEVIPPDEYSATTADWDLGAVCDSGRIEALPLAEGSGPGR